jgi:DNA replication protein DnaC
VATFDPALSGCICPTADIRHRYERGSLIITTNKAYKNWPEIFNHDAGITSAILDRVLHHAETVVIEGKSFRMKDQIEP